MMNGLCNVNIELTSRCNKSCWMCGRRKIEHSRKYNVTYGDMAWELVEKIHEQLPYGITVQLHNNGEPLLYESLKAAIMLLGTHRLTSFNTNGLLLMERADDIIGNLDTMAISIIQDDQQANEQLDIIRRFMALKGDRKPLVVFRCLGTVDTGPYAEMGLVAKRILHSPMGSFDYEAPVTLPETGVCLDLLHHLTIDRYGRVFPCVRFDPAAEGVIGDIHDETLAEIWNGPKRQVRIQWHLNGSRIHLPVCKLCDYWGIPRGM